MTWKQFYNKYEREIIFFLVTLYYLGGFFGINYFNVFRKANYFNPGFDGMIPIIPEFVYIYFSMYIFVLLPYFFVKDKTYFRKMAFGYLFILVISYLLYLIYPVKMYRPEMINTDIASRIVAWIQSVDPGNNCFPSSHISIPFFIFISLYRYNKKYFFMGIRFFLILLSTMFIKQHYMVDVLAGLVLGLIAYLIYVRKK